MKNRIRNRYYKQILVTLLVVSLVPVIFLGYYVYSFVDYQMTAVYKTLATNLENQKKEFEITFQYVDEELIRLGLKATCQNAVNRERSAVDFQLFNVMQQEVKLISNMEEYLDDVYLVSGAKNWVMDSTSFASLDKHPANQMIRQLMKIQKSSFWYSEGGKLYMCRRVPVNALPGNGMLIAQFDAASMVRDISGDGEGRTIVLLNKENQVMIGPRDSEKMWGDVTALDQARRIWRDTDVLEIQYQNERYLLFQSVSGYNGWKYMLLAPAAQLSGMTKPILWMAVLIIAGLLTTDLMAILVFSRRLYLPIDEIDTMVKKGIRYVDGTVEGTDEDDGLRDRVQYMLTRTEEMNQKLVHEKRDGQQLFLRRVYQGEIVNPDQKLFEDNGFDTSGHCGGSYFVMAVKYHAHFTDEEDKELYLFALDNIASELTARENCLPPVLIGSLMYLTCYIKTDSNESATMKIQMLAMMIITTVKKYVKRSLNIGISQGFEHLSDIMTGVEESRKALQDAMGAEGEVNFYHSYYHAGENAKGYAAKKRRVQLLHYIDLGERESCKRELDEYISGISGLYYYMFKLEICKLVSEILNVYGDYGMEPDYSKVGDIIDFDITKTVNTYDKLKSYLWDYLLEPLFDTICTQVKERDMKLQVITYLMDNVERDINLEECAKHFNYNANYLSRWFKKTIGMTYTDFVTSKKMELCKTLLVDSDISVNELAERFGYSSPQNFIRVFKKYTLMTPGQYRKQEREKTNTQ